MTALTAQTCARHVQPNFVHWNDLMVCFLLLHYTMFFPPGNFSQKFSSCPPTACYCVLQQTQYENTIFKGPDNPTSQPLPIMSNKCCRGDGEGRKDKGRGGGSRSKKSCMWRVVCDKVVCDMKDSVRQRKWCMWQSCVWKMACDKVVCKRWCVTKRCVKHGVGQKNTLQGPKMPCRDIKACHLQLWLHKKKSSLLEKKMVNCHKTWAEFKLGTDMRHHCGLFFCQHSNVTSAWHPISSHGGSKSTRIDSRQVWVTEALSCAGSQDAVQRHQSMPLTVVTAQNEKFIAG